MTKVSLYLDEDVRVLLAEVLSNRGYDVIHPLEVGRTGKSDEEQLAYAVSHKRAILTHNIKDYIILSKLYEKQGRNHFGIIVSHQLPFNELLRRTLRFLSLHHKDSVKNNFIWLQNYK